MYVPARLLYKAKVSQKSSINKFIHLEGRHRILRIAQGLRVLIHLMFEEHVRVTFIHGTLRTIACNIFCEAMYECTYCMHTSVRWIASGFTK